MARPRKPAHARKWRNKWYLVYYDYRQDKERRLSFESLRAFTPEQRKDLVDEYRTREETDRGEVRQRGGRLAYDTNLIKGLDDFVKDINERELARATNPDAREGLAVSSAKELRYTVKLFRDWLVEEKLDSLTTGELDRDILARFLRNVATKKTKQGNKTIRRSSATLNKHRQGIKACLSFLDGRRPPVFPDYAHLKSALKPVRGATADPAAFSPAQLREFLSTALELEDPARKVRIVRRKPSIRKQERFDQSAPLKSATSVSYLFILLALTGARLEDILTLKWKDCDLERGRLTFTSGKTGRRRILPLINAPEGNVSPDLVKLLKHWKLQAGGREYVLTHNGLTAPIFPKKAWEHVRDECNIHIGPQRLRQNFCAYAASLGIPAAVSALWQGHGVAVAERYYRAQVLERSGGSSFEEAMGLNRIIASLLTDGIASRHRRKTT